MPKSHTNSKPNNTKYDIIIIGGGASGMFAGAVAGSLGKKVLILEKNKELGKKLKITGGGRCNITNAEFDERKLLEKYGKAEKFLYSCFSQFGVKDTIKYFESVGLPIVVQENKRAFPKTEMAIDVFSVLNNELKKFKVDIITSCSVNKIIKKDKKIISVVTPKGVFYAQKYILATGGVSHPETGSTGDGFKWLSELGHSVTDPTPTIVPLAVSDIWVKKIAGVTVKNVKITFYLDKEKSFVERGDILFTHFGLSGPMILNSARKVDQMLQTGGSVTAKIDLFPKENHGQIDKMITAVFDKNKNKKLNNVLKDFLPDGVGSAFPVLLGREKLETKVHSVTSENRKDMVGLIKAMPVTITNLMGYDRAVVADGGVSLLEIDTKTMRSKVISNLYITGDLLNVNRRSGGYSLQLCWTTGYVAGKSCCK